MLRRLMTRPLRLLLVAVAAAATVVGVVGAAPADTGGKPYLALGDSVVFGYITSDGFAYTNADNFVGYPDYVGQALRLRTVNAACPGEATGGFIDLTSANDNGCRAYRAHFPLHVGYQSSQLDFATSYLRQHPETRLVTLGVGANDAFIVQRACANDPTCIATHLPGLLQTIGTNIDTIVRALRATRFHGVIVVANYYSLDYNDAAGTGLTALLNNAITGAATADGALVADEFTAFAHVAAARGGGNTCHAGLLNVSPASQAACDVHPSQSGQQLLAQTVEKAYWDAVGD